MAKSTSEWVQFVSKSPTSSWTKVPEIYINILNRIRRENSGLDFVLSIAHVPDVEPGADLGNRYDLHIRVRTPSRRTLFIGPVEELQIVSYNGSISVNQSEIGGILFNRVMLS